MKWFWNYVRRRLHQEDHKSVGAVKVDTAVRWDSPCMNLRVTPAVGGTIVTVIQFDRARDRHDERVYVIPDTQDFNQELCRIISLERLRG